MRSDEFEGIEALSELRHSPVTALLVVMLAGSVGVGLRYGLDALVTARTGSAFPWSTLAVNIAGAFALGVLAALLAMRPGTHPLVHPALGIGLLGGFTTYSAFALESVVLIEAGSFARAAVYIGATNVLGITGCLAGALLGRALS